MLNKRIALVTGGSRGIGAAIAKQLAEDGLAVVVNYAGRVVDANQVVDDIVRAGGQAMAWRADVSNTQAVKGMFDVIESEWGAVDVLVNNAGIVPATLPVLADTRDDTFDQLVSINLKGTFNTLREASTRLCHGGRIINLSSSLVGLLMPGYSVYTATKAAVEAMSGVFAKELRGRRISVNVVAPGPTSTELFFNGKIPEAIERLTKTAPLERLGKPQDIADMVAFLASPAGEWVNGQVIRVNGGII